MKKSLLIVAFVASVSVATRAQVVFNKHFGHMNTYGAKSSILFPEDKAGFADFQEVVQCPETSQADIYTAIENWLNKQILQYGMEIKDKYTSANQIAFRAEVGVGQKLIGTPAAATFVELQWETSESDLAFLCIIDIKEGRFRYHFMEITSDRWRLRGDAEGEGPINDIHWQRVNCLTRDMKDTCSDRKKKEFQSEIDAEWRIYKMEAKVMEELISTLRACVSTPAEEEW